jgi:hypothetical protein
MDESDMDSQKSDNEDEANRKKKDPYDEEYEE